MNAFRIFINQLDHLFRRPSSGLPPAGIPWIWFVIITGILVLTGRGITHYSSGLSLSAFLLPVVLHALAAALALWVTALLAGRLGPAFKVSAPAGITAQLVVISAVPFMVARSLAFQADTYGVVGLAGLLVSFVLFYLSVADTLNMPSERRTGFSLAVFFLLLGCLYCSVMVLSPFLTFV